MKKLFRLIDANINRVCEGVRVLEDITRFYDDDRLLSSRLRNFRHVLRKRLSDDILISTRNIKTDVGCTITKNSTCDDKSTLFELKLANMKRVQEGIRSIEESLKVVDQYDDAKFFESLRYESYDLEAELFRKKYVHEDLYLILSEENSNGRNSKEVLEIALKSGVRVVQYREKTKSKREQMIECCELIQLIRQYGALFIVNDHLDVALTSGADGVHLGQDDLPIEQVREIAPHLIIGVSTHNLKQATEAENAGADYIGVGPIFPTTTKLNIEPSEGLNFLEEVSKNITIPYVAIGGIKTNHVKKVKSYGAGCAMISEIVSAENISRRIENIKKELY